MTDTVPTCPCGSTDLRPPGRWAPYHTCRVCGTGVTQPVEGAHFWTYGVEPSAEQHAFWSGRDRQWEALVGPGSGRLLDFGCGVGHFVRWGLDRGWDAWGCDIDPWARERSVAPDRIVSDPRDLDYPFDLVTLWDVLEHTSDPVGLASSLRPLLRPGARIVVDSPNFAAMKLRWWWLRRNPQRFYDVIRPHQHAIQFTEAGLHRTLNRAGFSGVVTLDPPLSRRRSRTLDALVRVYPALRRGLFVTGVLAGDASAP
jgi:SAM-dependent methyltransferase